MLTLEAFRAEVEPNAFYSQRELVAQYVETKPIRRRHDLCRAARADAGAAPALVPRLGAIGAQPISDFIAQHPAPQPVPGAPADVVPLEALRVPAALDGSAGLNARRCRRTRPNGTPTCRQ
ncbi:hypothetical protein [Burkholderia vietnamiensis]|uniref:hypothetical protein n=1 Tax=Burkholderia vietnamiensis TaxID=60552 RepID=UPI001CF31674|nr:hypothetical protein [Burkholderia vietnamiensis]MCA8395585.1 hypothetical protein [Burkholderia vietnamiensis]